MEIGCAVKTDARTLADALKGADVFLGLSAAKAMTPEMLKSMADRPIVFAMAIQSRKLCLMWQKRPGLMQYRDRPV